MSEVNKAMVELAADLAAQADSDRRISVIATVALADQIEAHQAALKELREQFLAKLPEASEEQMAAVLKAAANETETPEGCKLGRDFRLTAEQEAKVKAARDTRVAYLSTRKAELINPLVACTSTALKSFKVRVGTNKTTTTARFEKTVAAKPAAGLIARLRAELKDKGWK